MLSGNSSCESQWEADIPNILSTAIRGGTADRCRPAPLWVALANPVRLAAERYPTGYFKTAHKEPAWLTAALIACFNAIQPSLLKFSQAALE